MPLFFFPPKHGQEFALIYSLIKSQSKSLRKFSSNREKKRYSEPVGILKIIVIEYNQVVPTDGAEYGVSVLVILDLNNFISFIIIHY